LRLEVEEDRTDEERAQDRISAFHDRV
jgi:hypothetical protein